MGIFYLFFLIFFIFLNIFLYLNAPNFYNIEIIYLMPSLFLFLLFFLFKKINNKDVDWFSIDSIFVVMFYLFHFGYLYLYAFGLKDYDDEVFWDSRYIYKSIHLLTICCSSFLLGFFVLSQKTNLSKKNIEFKNINGVYFLSKILILIVFLMFWLPLLSIASIAFSDYEALISVGELSPIGKLYWIGQYLGVAALALYYLCKANLNKNFFDGFFSLIPFFYIIGYFIIGDRGGFLFYAIIPLVIYNLFYRKINIKKSLLLGLFILFFSAVIATSRVESNYNFINAVSSYQDKKENNILVESISEFGKSFKTIPIIMSYIPQQYDYWYGKSYLEAFLITFPSLFNTRTSASISAWLTETAFGKDTYGRGGSITMESYGNFGVLGSIPFFIFLGALSGYLYKKYCYSSSLIYAISYVALVSSLCLWMRNSSNVVFRTVIWAILICWLFMALSRYLPYAIRNKK